MQQDQVMSVPVSAYGEFYLKGEHQNDDHIFSDTVKYKLNNNKNMT
jgi:hypothetical protein